MGFIYKDLLIRGGGGGSIHVWGTKKECLIEKWLQMIIVDFLKY
jgi:hypothetical protein